MASTDVILAPGVQSVDPAAQPAPLAALIRGAYRESIHRGYLEAVDTGGKRLLSLGASPHIFPRSAIKPMQALPAIARGAAERFDLGPEHIAVMCASHDAEPFHRTAVAEILERIGATEADLHCGAHSVSHRETAEQLIREGRKPTAIYSNCSGKHAGMMALARQLDAPLQGYWEPDHACQRAIQATLGLLTDRETPEFRWGIDGCGVPTYLLQVHELALAFARMANPDALPPPETEAAKTIARSMNAKPEYVHGTGLFNSVLMGAYPGLFVVKGGAEGCIGIGIIDRGLGLAIKVEDGNARALPAIALEALARLDALPEPLPPQLRQYRHPVLKNTRGEVVGNYETLF